MGGASAQVAGRPRGADRGPVPRRRFAAFHHQAASALCVASAIWLVGAAHAQGAALEFAVKANYLYKFGPFVEWPPQAFAAPSSPFYVCVAGDDPFGPALNEAVRGQRVGDHPVAIHRSPTAEREAGCHVLFASRSAVQSTPDMLRAVAGRPVLTVTDERLGGSGGMIQFVIQDRRVRFEIDAAAARANGLAIGSKLQQLAVPARKAAR